MQGIQQFLQFGQMLFVYQGLHQIVLGHLLLIHQGFHELLLVQQALHMLQSLLHVHVRLIFLCNRHGFGVAWGRVSAKLALYELDWGASNLFVLQTPRHAQVRNTGIEKFLAFGNKAGAYIKTHGACLRIQKHRRGTARLCGTEH